MRINLIGHFAFRYSLTISHRKNERLSCVICLARPPALLSKQMRLEVLLERVNYLVDGAERQINRLYVAWKKNMKQLPILLTCSGRFSRHAVCEQVKQRKSEEHSVFTSLLNLLALRFPPMCSAQLLSLCSSPPFQASPGLGLSNGKWHI